MSETKKHQPDVITGTEQDFFARGREISSQLDQGAQLEPRRILSVEDPDDLAAAHQAAPGGEERGPFEISDADLDANPDNGKNGVWRVNGIRHSCLVCGVSTAREARDRAIKEEAVQDWEVNEVLFVGQELPEVIRLG